MISLERSEKRNHKQREKEKLAKSAQHKAQKSNRISYTRQVFLLDTLNLTFKG